MDRPSEAWATDDIAAGGLSHTASGLGRAPSAGTGSAETGFTEAGESPANPPVGHTPPDRLLAAMLLLLGVLIFMGLPFVLSHGAVVFLPLVTAFVLMIILAPVADALDRLGLPNSISSFLAIVLLMLILVVAGLLIVQPALNLASSLPDLSRSLGEHIHQLQAKFAGFTKLTGQLQGLAGGGKPAAREVVISSPTVVQQLAMATPSLVFEVLVTFLLGYFMIESRIRIRRSLLLERTSVGASLRAARTLREVQERVSAYIATISMINVTIGVIVGTGAWLFGMEAPVMWGGLAAMFNFLPYMGPLIMAGLLALFNLAGSQDILTGLAPALCYLGLHAIEANLVTPKILHNRFTISPVAILFSISYFTWVWGVLGALLSMPILITLSALIDHVGKPNVIGFIFGDPLFDEKVEKVVGPS